MWLVQDPHISNKQWALKVASDTHFYERERAALQGLQALRSPALPRLGNILKVSGRSALVLTYFHGSTLENQRFSWRKVFGVVKQLAVTLQQIHDHGWLYLDLKPANVIMGKDGTIHLIDFGLAQPKQSAASEAVGTAGFASPEQLTKSVPLSTASDVYALGALGLSLLEESASSFESTQLLIPERFFSFLQQMIATNPVNRPTLHALNSLEIEILEQSMQRCSNCQAEFRATVDACPRCKASVIRTEVKRPTLQAAERLLPPSKVVPPGGNSQMVISDLLAGRRVSPEIRDLRLAVEELSRVRGFEDLKSPLTIKHLIQFYPHQVAAATRVLRDMRGNAILADEVGLGKTIEAGLIIKELLHLKMLQRVLVLTPSHLVDQWAEEMSIKFDIPFKAYEGVNDWQRSFLVASIHSAQRNQDLLRNLPQPFEMIVIDEMHNLLRKNGSPKQVYQLIEALPRNYTLLLSATPIRRYIVELYHLVNLIRPGTFRSETEFLRLYTQYGGSRATNTTQLRLTLNEVMVRNHRANMDPGMLPPPREVQPRELTPNAAERHLEQAALDLVSRRMVPTAGGLSMAFSSPASQQALLARYQLPAAEVPCAKLEETANIVQQAQGKVIVFTRENATAEWLSQQLRRRGFDTILFRSGLSRPERSERFWRFKKSQRGVLVSTDVGAEGRNLQFAHHLINFDLPWNPLRLEQRIGRIDRLGQIHTPTVYNLFYTESFEGDVYRLFDAGLRMFDLIVGQLVLVLEEMNDYGEQPLDEVISNLWLRFHSEPAQLAQQMVRLRSSLQKARQEFDRDQIQERSLDEDLF